MSTQSPTKQELLPRSDICGSQKCTGSSTLVVGLKQIRVRVASHGGKGAGSSPFASRTSSRTTELDWITTADTSADIATFSARPFRGEYLPKPFRRLSTSWKSSSRTTRQSQPANIWRQQVWNACGLRGVSPKISFAATCLTTVFISWQRSRPLGILQRSTTVAFQAVTVLSMFCSILLLTPSQFDSEGVWLRRFVGSHELSMNAVLRSSIVNVLSTWCRLPLNWTCCCVPGKSSDQNEACTSMPRHQIAA